MIFVIIRSIIRILKNLQIFKIYMDKSIILKQNYSKKLIIKYINNSYTYIINAQFGHFNKSDIDVKKYQMILIYKTEVLIILI